MRLLPSILTLVLVACAPGVEAPASLDQLPSMVAPTPTPYAYPELPGGIEQRIAEADCDGLDTVAEFMSRDSVDPVVRHDAMDAISHRSRELGC